MLRERSINQLAGVSTELTESYLVIIETFRADEMLVKSRWRCMQSYIDSEVLGYSAHTSRHEV